MRKVLGGLSLLTILVVSLTAAPVHAEKSKTFRRAVSTPLYDTSKEVTMEGTIQGIVKKPTPGTMLGTHLTVSTPKGTVDAHIGSFVVRGAHPYTPEVGQSVKLVGVMATVNHKNVFLTRSIDTGSRTIEVRSEHGFLIVPGAKGRIFKTSTTGGAR